MHTSQRSVHGAGEGQLGKAYLHLAADGTFYANVLPSQPHMHPGSRVPALEEKAPALTPAARGTAAGAPRGRVAAETHTVGPGPCDPSRRRARRNLDESPTLGFREEVAALVCQGNLLP